MPRQVTGVVTVNHFDHQLQACCPDLDDPPVCGDWSTSSSSQLSAGNNHQREPRPPDTNPHSDHPPPLPTALVSQQVRQDYQDC